MRKDGCCKIVFISRARTNELQSLKAHQVTFGFRHQCGAQDRPGRCWTQGYQRANRCRKFMSVGSRICDGEGGIKGLGGIRKGRQGFDSRRTYTCTFMPCVSFLLCPPAPPTRPPSGTLTIASQPRRLHRSQR